MNVKVKTPKVYSLISIAIIITFAVPRITADAPAAD